MATETDYKNVVDASLEVMDLAQATDLCQSMEARGDFKYKGIFAIFTGILDWTSRFSANGILPTMEQLGRDNNLEIHRVREYIVELLGRGSNKSKMVVAFPAVDFVGGPNPNLLKLLVFCRPPKGDGTSARRYYTAYLDKNVKAIAKWIETRRIDKGSEYSKYLLERIRQGRLPDTQDGAEIARFFYSDLDTTPDQKKLTYSVYARPVLQRLIENRSLIFLSRKGNTAHPYKGVFINNVEQLRERFRVLADYFMEHIRSDTSVKEATLEKINEQLSSFSDQALNGLTAGNRQVVLELYLLVPALMRLSKEKEEKDRTDQLEKVLADLAKRPGFVDMQKLRITSDDIRNSLIRAANVLHCEFPLQGRVMDFVIHRDSIPVAVKTARDNFERTGDDTEIQILSSLGVERFMDNEMMRSFQDMERGALFGRLPWYTRIWRILFGKGKIRPEEMAKIKKEINRSVDEERLRIRTTEAKRAQKKLVNERLKGSSEAGEESASTRESGAVREMRSVDLPESEEELLEKAEARIEKGREMYEEDARAEETLGKIVDILDRAWDEKLLPNREYLLQRLQGFDEDALIMFLKKYGRKEIYSFRVKNEKPEYKWPILMTRKYINRHGSRLLRKAMEDADEQRKALMPNQEKFDVATAIEDFLGRILNKPSS